MKTSLPKQKFYLNPKMQKYLAAPQRKKIVIAGRGASKSFTNGLSVAQKVDYMPRGIGSFLGETYTQILTNTLLPMINAWERMGYYKDYHYVIGKRPPKHFQTPFQPPQRFENVISWFNGHALIFGSMDRPELLRGGSRDYNISDEALNLSQDSYKTIVVPTLRGSDISLMNKPHFKNQEFTSSMPHHFSKGRWILDMELEVKNFSDDVFYIESTSIDNIEILSSDTIREWRRDMGKYRFNVECLNKRVNNLSSSFYASLSADNFYTPQYNYSHIDNLEYNLDPKKGDTVTTPDSRWDSDCDTSKPLNLSHDWGGRINCLTIDQEINNCIKVINAMHVTPPMMIDDLAHKFCHYYRYHKKKVVYQWGDKSGDKKEANSKLTYFEQFADILRSKGWVVQRKKVAWIDHAARYNFINRLLKGDDSRLPILTMNEDKCKALIIAMQSTPVKDLQKDKSSENSTSVLPEHATHYTDAFDYRFFHGYHDRTKRRSYASPVDIR